MSMTPNENLSFFTDGRLLPQLTIKESHVVLARLQQLRADLTAISDASFKEKAFAALVEASPLIEGEFRNEIIGSVIDDCLKILAR